VSGSSHPVKRAQRAYEIATQSLFRDCSSYSFDKYQRELASDLSLADLQRFTERFLGEHRRQLQKKDAFVEFIVPDVLTPWKLPERYRQATFDRELAIHRGDAEFLALGHPLVEAILQYVGSYDFGGLTALRRILDSGLAGRSGFLFLFVVRQRVPAEGGTDCLFQFQPVFVDRSGKIDDEAAMAAVKGTAKEEKGTHCEVEPALFLRRRGGTSNRIRAFGAGRMMLSFWD
jgi:hypothetical protein